MKLSAHGVTVTVPRGWDARIFRRSESDAAAPATDQDLDGPVPQSGITAPVLHVANFPLPEGRGDYGSGAVGLMRSDHVFLALVEFGPESVGTPLFAATGIPKLRVSEISSTTLQRPQGTLGGAQRFFTASNRAFCCYAVVGSVKRRAALVPALNRVLAGVTIAPG
ncbi:MAG: hypothetical protein U0Q22_00705 [Acidimicrobiales bacterium]